MAAALIVPVAGIVSAQGAGATQGTGGNFSCNGTAGAISFRPGLLLNKSRLQRITGSGSDLECTGGSVTGGQSTFNLQKDKKLRCVKLRNGPAGEPGGINGTLRVIWNKADKAGQTLLTLNFKVSGSDAHSTDVTLSGSVRFGAIAVGKKIEGTLTFDKGLKSIPNGGDCATLKPLTGAAISAISFKTVAADAAA